MPNETVGPWNRILYPGAKKAREELPRLRGFPPGSVYPILTASIFLSTIRHRLVTTRHRSRIPAWHLGSTRFVSPSASWS